MANIFDLGPDFYSVPGEWNHDGRPYGKYVRQDIVEHPEIAKIRSDDCFVVTYPKSGTTWTLEIAHLVMNGGDTSISASTPHVIKTPFMEFKLDGITSLKEASYDGLSIMNKLKPPRLVKSHLPVDLLPQDIYKKGCKIRITNYKH
uniref:Sulfotransferase 1 family member D1-like n=1 Tax=Saccoglossus kowalevskii TaxID=10224 RepID=A0ABM0MV70_SACKO|nr:PREDICTED: sulfotransferase 1 family member D1-like [Saccoglossus kowalevskii]